jgi:hypothetical protein
MQFLCKFKSENFEDFIKCTKKNNILPKIDKVFDLLMDIDGDWFKYYKD